MAREFAKAFYRSAAWAKCRAAYIAERQAIDGGMCETCRERPGYIVHHKVWLTQQNIGDPDIALNHANLKFDCQPCHNREGVDAPRCTFDASGQPIPAAPPEMKM